MRFENVTLKVSIKEAQKVKTTISLIEEIYPNMIVTPFKYGKLSDDIVVTFKVDDLHHTKILEKLIVNNMTVLGIDDKTRQILREINLKRNPSSPPVTEDWEDTKNKIKTIPGDFLDRLIDAGNYNEVIKISLDLRADREIVRRAKDNISTAVFNAIESVRLNFEKKLIDPAGCVRKLMEIASDKSLKNFRKDDLIKYAGYEAINYCTLSKDSVTILIKISNNSSLNQIINLKAAVKFSEIIFSNVNSFQLEIREALKELNIRWLYLAYDVHKYDLDHTERELLERLIDFIQTERTKSEGQ